MMFETIAKNFVKEYNGEKKESDSKYQGTGDIKYFTNNTYSGAFNDGKLEGNGIYTWRDGVTYKGEFRDNKIVGTGEFDWKNGCKYEGHLKNGLRHGYGIFEVARGKQTFEGTWKEGKAHGKGTCRFKLGGQYSGEWKEGKKHGNGTMIYASGNIYDGEWKNNVKAGQGKMRWVSKNEIYEGSWLEGKPNGFGVYTWKLNALRDHQFPFNNTYKGNWLNGMRNGFGTFYYANGSKYEGEWKDNIKHGKGRYITNNGRFYEGVFDNDQILFDSFENGKPFIFHLPESAGPKDAVLKEINSIITRHIDELRSLYHNYCVETKKMTGQADRNVINRRVIWHFYRTSGIIMKNYSLAELNRAYAKYFKDDPVFCDRYNDPHNPTTEFIFHDLLEHLLLIAHYLYGDKPLVGVHEKGLPGVFAYFLKIHVLPNIAFKHQEVKMMQNKECFKIFDEIENKNKIGMFDAYSKIAHRTKNSLIESARDNTLSFREFALYLKEFCFFEKYPELTMQKLIPRFSQLLPAIEENGTICLEYEIIILDFRRIFSECAILAFSNILAKIENLKYKEENSVSLASITLPPSVTSTATSADIETCIVISTPDPSPAIVTTVPATPTQATSTVSAMTIPPSHHPHTRRKSNTPAPRPRSGTHSAKKRQAAAVDATKEEVPITSVHNEPTLKPEAEVVFSPEPTIADCMKELKTGVTEFYEKLYEKMRSLNPTQHLLSTKRASQVVKILKEKVEARRSIFAQRKQEFHH